MTTLNDALARVADYLHLNAEELATYAAETPQFPDMPYGGMSIDREEGMFLYAIVKALKPDHALEIGMFEGVSSQHILTALEAVGGGELHSIDIASGAFNGWNSVASWHIHVENALTADLPSADFVFEDSDHQLPAAADILAKVKALNPRVVVSHDYYSDVLYADPVGFQVREAFGQVFGAGVLGVQWDGSPRGFGLWLNPEWKAPEAEPAKPTPGKRTAKKAATKK